MNWFDWMLVALFAYSALLVVAQVGKPKKPTEPVTAAIVVAIDAALIVGLVLTR
jgi:hypothetical protein